MAWRGARLARLSLVLLIRGSRAIFSRDLATAASSGLRVAQQLPARRAAICFAGGFRTFSRTAGWHKKKLVDSWPAADVFMFLEMEDTFTRARVVDHNAELPGVRAILNPIAVRTYTQQDAKLHQGGIQCLQKGSMSHQLWSVRECFGMAKQHERERDLSYTWFVRARPDAIPRHHEIPVARNILRYATPDAKVAWRRRYGPGSDMLVVLTRAAADTYDRAHESIFQDVGSGQCGFGSVGVGDVPVAKQCRRCDPAYQGHYRCNTIGPECLVYLTWLSDNVTVIFDEALSTRIVRHR